MGIFIMTPHVAGEAEAVSSSVAIVLEGQEVIHGLKDVAKATCLLFGLIYALNLIYPKEYKYFFEVIQKVFMELDGDRLSPKVQSLKNKLCA